MKNSDFPICELIESKMNEIILKINQTHEIFEADKLHIEPWKDMDPNYAPTSKMYK